MFRIIFLIKSRFVINIKKLIISKSAKKVGKLELNLIKEKKKYKNLLFDIERYSRAVLKTEKNM